MPIRPEMKDRYPAEWPMIRMAILERAKHKCEQCGKPNRKRVHTMPDGRWVEVYELNPDPDAIAAFPWRDSSGRECPTPPAPGIYEQSKIIKVVLTVAHLDHIPENCDHDNLRAWCQRCHLRYDANEHARNAANTRSRNRRAEAKAAGQDELPGVSSPSSSRP